jgi:hypothetical protein
MGADPGDDNFIAILLGSLPASYDPYLAALTATSALLNQTIDPDTYIRGISDEAERRRIKGRAKEEKEAAFNTNGSSSGQGRRGNKRSSTIECYNCHKKGHIKSECWAKGGGKEGQGPKGKGRGRAAANKAADDDDGVWYAHADSSEADSELDDWKEVVETNLAGYVEPWFEYAQEGGKERLEGLSGTYLHDEIAQPYAEEARNAAAAVEPIPDPIDDASSDTGSMPSLQTVSDTDWSDDDLPALLSISNSSDRLNEGEELTGDADAEVFSEYDPGENIPDLEEWSQIDAEGEEEDYTLTFTSVFLAAAATIPNEPEVDLYDSGASRHMTPYCHRLFNYSSIPPKSITAADKGKFEAVGKGDMHIYLPGKGGARTRILVRDVLYAPKLGVALLSVSKITAAGYSVLFRATECRIYDSKDKVLGKIPMRGGLYRTETDAPSANAAQEPPISVTLDDLHQMLGHISPDAARRLIKEH